MSNESINNPNNYVAIRDLFTYHPATVNQHVRLEEIRRKAHEFALTILECCPLNAYRTLAIRKLQEVAMMANICIVVGESKESLDEDKTGEQNDD